MKPTAEDLKLVAEAMGIYKEIVEDHKVPWQPLITNEGNVWNPTEDAEQCFKLIKWLESVVSGIWMERKQKGYEWSCYIVEKSQQDYKEDVVCIHKDFKTAVFLAALEYIKNKK